MARPSKLNPETTDRVALLIRAGNTAEVACQAAGISRETFYTWLRRGETARPDSPYFQFAELIEQSKAEAEATLVTRIAKAAANGSWSAAAWLLERGAPERWAKVSERKLLDEAPNFSAEDTFAALDEEDELAKRRTRAT